MGSFMEMWEQMGVLAKLVIVVLAIQSVWSIGVMIERYLTYRKARKQSQEFAPLVAEALGKGNLEEAIELAEQYNKSHLARVVHAGLQEFQSPLVKAKQLFVCPDIRFRDAFLGPL